MAIFLEIIETPDPKLKGHVVEIFPGLKIGRREGQLVIQDAHLSGHHATIEKVGQDRFALVDNESHNGIILNGRRVKRVSLLPDVVFLMGETSFKVVVQSESVLDVSALVSWQERLKGNLGRFLRSIDREKESELEGQLKGLDLDEVKSKDLPLGPYYQIISPFPYPIKLTFTEGPQAETSWILGYGPRRAGFKHFDLSLSEPHMPNELFEVRAAPDSSAIEIVCFDEDALSINGHTFHKAHLKHGDRLRLGKSEIQVEIIGDDEFESH